MRQRATRPSLVSMTILAVLALAAGRSPEATQADAQYRVVPLWPRPLPNHWILGSVTGVAVDGQDHVWLVHRGLASLNSRTEAGLTATPPSAEYCCLPAPPVLEFDAAGNLVGHWGGPGAGYDWPESPGGLAVDARGNVWIAAAGPPEGTATGGGRAGAGRRGGGGAAVPAPADAHVLKFSGAGRFLLQIGKPGETGAPDSATNLDAPVDVAIDSQADEVYVADGGTHQRIAVFNATTGALKRQWSGAPAPFAHISCLTLGADGAVYVCDRGANQIRVFDRNGTPRRQGSVSAATKGLGAVWDAALSSNQRTLFVADGQDERVFVLRADALDVVTAFGDGGRQPGQFRAVAAVATDSKGNIYTGEAYEGKRLQKFETVFRGPAPAASAGRLR